MCGVARSRPLQYLVYVLEQSEKVVVAEISEAKKELTCEKSEQELGETRQGSVEQPASIRLDKPSQIPAELPTNEASQSDIYIIQKELE